VKYGLWGKKGEQKRGFPFLTPKGKADGEKNTIIVPDFSRRKRNCKRNEVVQRQREGIQNETWRWRCVLTVCVSLRPLIAHCFGQRSQQPKPELVVACYRGDEAVVRRHLQGDALNLDYQVCQMLYTLSSLRFVDLRCSILQFVSLCSSRSAALTAHSCMCMRRCLCHGMANSG
jgi:hypothetical protein